MVGLSSMYSVPLRLTDLRFSEKSLRRAARCHGQIIRNKKATNRGVLERGGPTLPEECRSRAPQGIESQHRDGLQGFLWYMAQASCFLVANIIERATAWLSLQDKEAEAEADQEGDEEDWDVQAEPKFIAQKRVPKIRYLSSWGTTVVLRWPSGGPEAGLCLAPRPPVGHASIALVPHELRYPILGTPFYAL
jgi:hypothetical protein